MQDSPSLVAPYCGMNQQQTINVPATIAYKGYRYAPEESCWAMPSYASLYPEVTPTPRLDFLPPPISKTDLWSAQQQWPL